MKHPVLMWLKLHRKFANEKVNRFCPSYITYNIIIANTFHWADPSSFQLEIETQKYHKHHIWIAHCMVSYTGPYPLQPTIIKIKIIKTSIGLLQIQPVDFKNNSMIQPNNQKLWRCDGIDVKLSSLDWYGFSESYVWWNGPYLQVALQLVKKLTVSLCNLLLGKSN